MIRPASSALFAALILATLPLRAEIVVSDSIFVAKSGVDDVSCGVTPASPCLTIGQGLSRAVEETAAGVHIQAGSYSEVVQLVEGIDLIGGYDVSWVQDDRTLSGHTVEIVGGFWAAEGQYVTLVARDVHAPTSIENLVVEAPNATGTENGVARSSYAVHAVASSGLIMQDVTLVGGTAADGQAGSPGTNASVLTPPITASKGSNADTIGASCSETTAPGGTGGSNGTVGSTATGGSGGAGGPADTNCGDFLDPHPADVGEKGGNANTFSVSYGSGGPGGATCSIGQNGQPGRSIHGTGGDRAPQGSIVLVGDWWDTGDHGDPGQLGEHGTGGGGGGGSGGCDTGIDSYGAGGGGGGAGGQRAIAPGEGGENGGASFGIFLVSSFLDISNSIIQRGTGGDGGDGGNGGVGQPGGQPGAGGDGADDSMKGGDGGVGGAGGDSGGGGAGNGGDVYGIFGIDSGLNSLNVVFEAGTGGLSGSGGLSAKGGDGQNGLVGVVNATVMSGQLPPELLTPLDGASDLTIPVELTWDCAVGDGCQIQVDSTLDFLSPNVDSLLVGETLHLSDLSEGATYFWRARSYTATDTSGWSPCRSFSLAASDKIIDLTVLLEGAYNTGGAMSAGISASLPSNQPYSAAPWNYVGSETVDAGFGLANPSVVDWVLVQIRDTTPEPPAAMTVLAQRAGFVRTDGSVVDTNGVDLLRFQMLTDDPVYIVVYHRNHIPVMSSTFVAPVNDTLSYDFTDNLAKAYSDGSNAMQSLQGGSYYGLFGGDDNADGSVTATDFNAWLDATKSAATGYLSSDFNMNGQATATDFNLWLANTKIAASSQVPLPD